MEQMIAGPELDFLIDEKIFGYKKEKWCPAYSTDMRAAWLVVEKLRIRGYRLTISSGENTSLRYAVSFCSVDNRAKLMNSVGYTFTQKEFCPHAICLSALKAISL